MLDFNSCHGMSKYADKIQTKFIEWLVIFIYLFIGLIALACSMIAKPFKRK